MIVFGKIRNFLRMSPHFHIREHSVKTLIDLVHLLDRFLDDELEYPLEWDDFVSWKHAEPSLEKVRQTIAVTEPLFFSKSQEDNLKGKSLVLNERNRIAELYGMETRQN